MKFRSPVVAAVLDLLMVLLFAAIGRRSHAEATALSGLLHTAWPFVVGAAIGWTVTFALYRNKFDAFLIVPTGIVVWVMTVALGMVLRAVTGQGTAGSFIVVATLSTAVLLLGWRALAKFVPSVR
ncbi:DUF3054 domain-containing protein [Rhodococcoides fascians A21d2]|uniref:DUF3054 domain-containing protein n=1 Tax=Nocardiaceae TaxID=85025 RepID=UPI0005609C3B|nr:MULTISPECIES: DUF3054 domain-containing protein [Rhodococcus]OZC51130.1 DUF3054 domain-containing protein [Rhodococcus sp. WWJCD1]QIH99304.1 DUF3054 domain-containing protein [Rhodococcus fascians A21d2]